MATWTAELVWLVVLASFVLLVAWRAHARSAPLRGLGKPRSAPSVPELETWAEAPREIGEVAVVHRGPEGTRYPVVLAHGYFGFDRIEMRGFRREYFRGVRERLEAAGYTVHVVRLAPAAGIALRAAQLAQQVERLPAERVNIIAHSMGGLDARYAITTLGLGDRVASLTTVGCPHRGTPLADTSAALLGEWMLLRRMLHSVGANVDGLYDLRTGRMEEFNRAVTDCPDVFYSSVVGALPVGRAPAAALLAPGHAYLLRRAGPNDGLVPAESQRWGTVLGEVEADHWAQIGWSGGFDTWGLYSMLVSRLRERGL